MSGENLPMNIPFNKVADHLNCPVCMCQLKNCYITPCGHRYCEHCIKECVDRLRKCPCCNQIVRVKELIRDHQYDEFVATVNREKEKAEKLYFSNLIDSGFKSTGAGVCENQFSPVEQVLKKHLKESLGAHEKYYQDMKKDVQIRKDLISEQFKTQKIDLEASTLSPEEKSHRLLSLQDEYNSRKEELDEDLKKTSATIAETYDRYLTENLPSLHFLPVSVSLVLLSKNITIDNVMVNPQHDIEDIKQTLTTQMVLRGDKVVNFGQDLKFFTFGPFGKLSGHEMFHIVRDILENGASHTNVQMLPDACKPVLQFGLKPGGVVAIYGQVTCESDLPKECFASVYQRGSGQVTDYFTCQDCSFNWICRSCMEVCHKSHTVVPYIMKHQPTWACCYCPKKKKCVIQVNSTQRPVSSLF